MKRRHFIARLMTVASLSFAITGGAIPWSPVLASQAAETKVFSRDGLREEARKLSMAPYAPAVDALPAWIADLDWDRYQSIGFKPEKSLWRKEKLLFQVRLFHLGLFFKHPITIHEVVNGRSVPVRYSRDLFNYGPKVQAPDNPGDLGFAGFRVHAYPDFDRDMFSFLGASYFRAVGGSKQYGLSARGLAVDTGLARPEEFPEFRSFWIERPAEKSDRVILHALLDSPSVTGAYTFEINPGDSTVMEVEAHLFPRKNIERVGIAPLTSMFQYGENDRRVSDDFRPEIHDSDGLALLTGAGEWIWRPLVNSPVVRVNSFLDENPRGFGLMQRDRDFDHYQDDGAMYHQRPSVWVEPLGEWGKGAVQLVEIPTLDETFDNIVAFWNPSEPFQAGQERTFRYRLHWESENPVRNREAQVISTRIGAGGTPGQKVTEPMRKFVVDFAGGRLDKLSEKDGVEFVVIASRGNIKHLNAYPLKSAKAWRGHFDLVVIGGEPVDLRGYLRDTKGALTETWMYQWTPPQ